MTWLTIGLTAAISLVALWYVIAPLLDTKPAPMMVEDDRLTELLAQKDTLLKSIKDLEFDFHVGKLDAEDYERFNQRMRRQAVGLLQQIEQLSPATASLDDQVEMLINRKRKVQRETETNGRSAAPAGTAPTGRFCTECGHPLAPQHKFCANCGVPMAAAAPPVSVV